MTLRSILATTAAALLVLPGIACASATGHVTLGNFTYSLTDLDPNDGITPSITFLAPGSGYPPGSIGFLYPGSYGSIGVKAVGTEPLSYSVESPGMSLRASVSGLGNPGTISLDAYASLDEAIGGAADADITANASLGFVLSPNTALTVMATDHLTLSAADYPGSDMDRVSTDVTLALRALDGSLLHDFYGESVYVYGYDSPVDRDGQILGTYQNTSSASLAGTLTLSNHIWAIAEGNPMSPVSEPANVAMLAAGLPLLLALRRRARRR